MAAAVERVGPMESGGIAQDDGDAVSLCLQWARHGCQAWWVKGASAGFSAPGRQRHPAMFGMSTT